MIFSVLFAFVLALIFCPIIIKICRKLGLYDEVNPRKIHKGKIPRLGGIALFSSFLLVWFFTNIFSNVVSEKFYFSLFFGFGIILLFGVIDDIFNMRAMMKFIAQMAAALVVSLSPYHFKHLFFLTFPPFVGEIITFIWIISFVNAFNLIDGMDWVCGGISFLIILTLGIIFKIENNPIYAFYFILSGSIAGFLVWNKPDAKIFLGDCGSQSLGYLIAVAPLFNYESSKLEFLQFPIMILLASIPITDVLAAIWRREREKRSFFSPDRAHIHHKLLNIGFSKRSAIFFLLAVQFVICLAALASYLMRIRNGIVVISFSLIFVWGIFITFHYLNRAVNIAHKGLLDEHPMN